VVHFEISRILRKFPDFDKKLQLNLGGNTAELIFIFSDTQINGVISQKEISVGPYLEKGLFDPLYVLLTS
jgi:hypothetical protein